MTFPTELPYKYTQKKDFPYYRELLPREQFEAIYENIKQSALGFLCTFDPSHTALYQEYFPKINAELDKEFFKESSYDMFAGCQDPESVSFKFAMRSSITKMAIYARFCMEKLIYKDELEAIPIKKPMYIVNLPRC